MSVWIVLSVGGDVIAAYRSEAAARAYIAAKPHRARFTVQPCELRD